MSETEAQKRERILHSERDHSKQPSSADFATAVTIASLGADPIDGPFHTLFAHPSKWSAPRGTTPTSVVIHCTAAENPASSTAAFFHSSSPSGSTQAIADDIQGFTMVPDDAVCAGAPPFNQEGLHIEQPGLTSWSRATWLSHDDQLRRVANWAAKKCKLYNIPVRLFHTADLIRDGERARCITYHDAVSQAFHQSTHTDPQPNFPWDVFMGYVHFYFDGGDDMTDDEKAALKAAADAGKRFEDYLKGENAAIAGDELPADKTQAMSRGFQNATAFLNRPKPGSGGNLQDHKHVPGGVQGVAP